MDAAAAPAGAPPDGWPDADQYADDLAAIHRVSTLGPGDHAVRLGQWLGVARDLLRARRAFILLGTASPFDVELVDDPGDVPSAVADHRVDLAIERQATVASLGGTASPPDGPRDLGDGAVVASPLWVSGELAGAVVLVASPDRPPCAAWTLALVDLVADGIARVLEHRADDTSRSRAAAEQAAFEALVASISTRLIASSAADLDQVIAEGLHAIAAFFGADLAFIDELSAEAGVRQRTHRWASPQLLPVDGVDDEDTAAAPVLGLLARSGHLVGGAQALRRRRPPGRHARAGRSRLALGPVGHRVRPRRDPRPGLAGVRPRPPTSSSGRCASPPTPSTAPSGAGGRRCSPGTRRRCSSRSPATNR
ncbi:MAG: hypothetical protein R2746_13825 [Acidimicrobiales bacterium]